jgi:PAS domain S-box-containing protein
MSQRSQQLLDADEDPVLRLAAIVETSDDAIISKDLNGIITSWNAGAERLFGYTPLEVIGKSITILIPPDHLDEEPEVLARIRRGERISHFETVRRRKNGSLVDISLSVSPVKDASGMIVGASKIARDITERKRAEKLLEKQRRRLESLDRVSKLIASDLEMDKVVQTVTDVATELSGAKFGAFFYNVLEEREERYMLYTLSGAPRSAFEHFGMPRNTAVFDPTFKGKGVVRSDDIRADPRYGHNAPNNGMPNGHLPVVSYLAVPVIGREGEVLGGLFFGHDRPFRFTQESEDNVVSIAAHAAIAINNARQLKAAQDEVAQRRRAEEAKELLLREIKHRIKNTLGIVQAMVGQTFKTAPAAERDVFGARLQALATAHDLLTERQWNQATITDVVDRAIAPFRERRHERFDASGVQAALAADKALLLAMVLHELGTNAVKYGALSNDAGQISVTWEFVDEEPRMVRLLWRETNGPLVVQPTRKGFGSTLIGRALANQSCRAKLDFDPTGVVCTLDLAL